MKGLSNSIDLGAVVIGREKFGGDTNDPCGKG